MKLTNPKKPYIINVNEYLTYSRITYFWHEVK